MTTTVMGSADGLAGTGLDFGGFATLAGLFLGIGLALTYLSRQRTGRRT